MAAFETVGGMERTRPKDFFGFRGVSARSVELEVFRGRWSDMRCSITTTHRGSALVWGRETQVVVRQPTPVELPVCNWACAMRIMRQ